MSRSPPHPYDCGINRNVKATSQFRVHFDGNRYSVPAACAAQPLLLRGYPNKVLIYRQEQMVAEHVRSYDRGQTVASPDHAQPLLDQRRRLLPPLAPLHLARNQDLRLTYTLEHFETMAKEAAAAGMPHLEYLQRLIGGETAQRFEKLVARRVREARMPFIKTLDPFRWSYPRKIDRTLVQTLHRLDFIRDKSNVIFAGPVGVGKTHLLLSLANTAGTAGHSVLFTTAANIVNTLTAAQIAGRLPRELRKYTSPALLAIDELGFVPLDKTGADLFFQVISERYERGAIVLTTNRIYKDWPVTFNNDSVFTSALLDRLLHHSHTVIIEGPSGRDPKHRPDSEA